MEYQRRKSHDESSTDMHKSHQESLNTKMHMHKIGVHNELQPVENLRDNPPWHYYMSHDAFVQDYLSKDVGIANSLWKVWCYSLE